MQNLGYFQLQAGPGLWRLSLAEGRASTLYSVVTNSGDSGASAGKLVAVKSFNDAMNRLIVSKRPGFEKVSLLAEEGDADEDEDDEDSFWGSLGSFFGGNVGDKTAQKEKKKKAVAAPAAEEDDRIHVFSLATGHMYERLLRIMMLSVTKRTSKPVKFWLFENYLSPTFKEIADLMAKTYGFEVGYVTYKWPEWLTQQTQKQRIIWGYKILFLDVLFPLNVKKVIYVDADQVLRADLTELWELDLEGKPYAYTPFCSSREETLGFQFWRSGYWADHLRGRPYHISALYVVDLQRFRRYAVGDRLRAVYDGLARDPNSLANLDQDLPNYAQHSVPIKSLPQEWLWCETWCSDSSKAEAKTIDLCNNPLHKEPKLDMARRVISGHLFNESWVELDQEIRDLETRSGINLIE
jgi:UDP-glucose:glycoprotein glucosyltransferase